MHVASIKFLIIFRYRTVETTDWTELLAINRTLATVDNLQPGERYVIQVRSVSHHVESFTPQEVEQTVRKYWNTLFECLP